MNRLSGELQRIDSISSYGIYDVYCENYSSRYFAIFELVKSAFLKGENNLLLFNESDRDIVHSIINKLQYKDYVLEVSQNQIDEQDWYRLKARSKQTISNFVTVDFDIAKYQFNQLRSKLISHWNDINKPLFGDKTYTELLQLASKSNKYFSSNYIKYRVDKNEFSFNQKEFWELKGAIEEASTLFDFSFIGLEQLNMFSVDSCKVMVDNDDVQLVLEILKGLSSKTESLLEDYYIYSNKFTQSQNLMYDSSYKAAMNKLADLVDSIKIEQIRQSATETIPKPRFGFRKSKKNLSQFIKKLSDLVGFCNEKILLNPSKIKSFSTIPSKLDDMLNLLVDLSSELTHQYNNRSSLIKSKSKRINIKNQESDIPSELNKQLNFIIDELNQTAIWNDKFENNSLSIFQQTKYLEKLNVQIITALSFLRNNASFMFWKAFIGQQTVQAKTIIKSLFKLPSIDWLNAYISWYLQELLDKYSFENMDITDTLFSYKELAEIVFEGQYRQQEEVWIKKQLEMFKSLKNSNRKLYNLIFKKSKPSEFSYDHYLNSQSSLFETVFPVTIIYSKNQEVWLNKVTHKWDNIFICSDVNQNVLPPNKKVLVFSQNQEATYKIKLNYFSIESFDTLTTRQQLDPAKELAKRLIEVCGDNLSLFSGDNSYIVSTVDSRFLQKATKHLEFDHVSSYNNSGNIVDNLTDIILGDKDDMGLFLIVKNELLNTKKLDVLDWQIELIKLFEMTGFKIVNVDNILDSNMQDVQISKFVSEPKLEKHEVYSD